jgi:NitT/TauT family transport system substrate-binding protein
MCYMFAAKRLCRVLLVISLLLGSSPAQLQARTTLPLRIGVIPSDFAAQAYYAKDTGLFARAGLNVEVEPVKNGAAAAAAILAGSLDVAYSNVLTLAIAHVHGLPLTALAVANLYSAKDPAAGFIGVKQTSSIFSAKDFDGKTIAVGALHDVTDLAAHAWVDKNGGDSRKVQWVEIQISEMAPIVLSGRVDGAVINVGVYPTLGKPHDPIRVVAHSYDAIAPVFAVGAWVTTKDWLSRHPDEARRFITAITEAARWGNTHHHASARILARYTRQSVAKIDASVRYEYGTNLTAALLQPQITAAANYGWLKKAFSAREIIM